MNWVFKWTDPITASLLESWDWIKQSWQRPISRPLKHRRSERLVTKKKRRPVSAAGGQSQLALRQFLSAPKQKKTLVLDLDETLVHSTSKGSRHHDHLIEVLIDKHVCLYYVYKRPHVDAFLKKVSEWYKIVIFTASMPSYADPVIDWLDSRLCVISKRYFRDSCTPVNGAFTKNLSLVDSDLSSVVLIDNSPISYSIYPHNGVPIDTWTEDPNDESLLDLLLFLDALRFTHDVRSIIRLKE